MTHPYIYVVMAHIVMAHTFTTHIVMPDMAMARVVMARVVMARVVMGRTLASVSSWHGTLVRLYVGCGRMGWLRAGGRTDRPTRHQTIYSYGLYSCGPI